VRIEELCVAALEDPFLPPYFRTKYEIYLAIVPGRNMETHLSSAEIMIGRMKELMADGTGSRWMQDNVISMESFLRQTRRDFLATATDVVAHSANQITPIPALEKQPEPLKAINEEGEEGEEEEGEDDEGEGNKGEDVIGV